MVRHRNFNRNLFVGVQNDFLLATFLDVSETIHPGELLQNFDLWIPPHLSTLFHLPIRTGLLGSAKKICGD